MLSLAFRSGGEPDKGLEIPRWPNPGDKVIGRHVTAIYRSYHCFRFSGRDANPDSSLVTRLYLAIVEAMAVVPSYYYYYATVQSQQTQTWN